MSDEQAPRSTSILHARENGRLATHGQVSPRVEPVQNAFIKDYVAVNPGAPQRAESYLNALTKTSETPGIQYLVATSAGVVFEHAGGWADIRNQLPVDSATTMMAYSMSKTITAVAALQLVQTGRIGLDDPVEHYADSPYGSGVTIRQLISHTSGIPN